MIAIFYSRCYCKAAIEKIYSLAPLPCGGMQHRWCFLLRRRIPKICIIIPAIAFGMVLAWCMPQKVLLVLLSLMLMVLGIVLILKG